MRSYALSGIPASQNGRSETVVVVRCQRPHAWPSLISANLSTYITSVNALFGKVSQMDQIDGRFLLSTLFFAGCAHRTFTVDARLFGRRIYELLKMFPRDLLSPQMKNEIPVLIMYKERSSLALTG